MIHVTSFCYIHNNSPPVTPSVAGATGGTGGGACGMGTGASGTDAGVGAAWGAAGAGGAACGMDTEGDSSAGLLLLLMLPPLMLSLGVNCCISVVGMASLLLVVVVPAVFGFNVMVMRALGN
mmetsp:Transcript_11089/g.25715  ORF Transcript_11089/g.25715 Transcript_11089/m.25715 type:complete len:122 (+) Transcript_11089:79-444(+)